MNLKKAKQLRQKLRNAGVPVSQAKYKHEALARHTRPTGKLDAMGKPTTHTYYTAGTTRLAHDCGRAVYQCAKQAA